MRAAQISEYGGPSVLRVSEVDVPAVGQGQALIEVHASSINPFDSAIRAGYMKDAVPLELPITLGGDFAGIVTETGEGVTNIDVGDKVYGQANAVAGNSGAFAEYTATSTNQVAKMPSSLDFKQAASLPLVGVSALQALTQHINLKADQKIFIHGGSGGIGTIAIQIAKHLGAHVTASATGSGVDQVKQLGADEIIDYKSRDFTEVISGYDAVFDTTPGQDFDKALTVLKEGGVAVSMIAKADESIAQKLDVTAITQSTKVTTETLSELRSLVETGVVVPQVDKVFPLSEISEAFTAKETGAANGKIVIEIKS